jgi:excisionase family DNA binding protein
VRARSQGDLVWRFQHADEELECSSTDAEARLVARDRVRRIDGALARLPTEPIRLAHALALRYGPSEAPANTRHLLRELALLAPLTFEATTWFERVVGDTAVADFPRVQGWLESLCARIYACDSTGGDRVIFDEIRRGTEELLREAESAYERATMERTAWLAKPSMDRSPLGSRSAAPRRKLKPFYTTPELARALGISRWTVRRWLDAHRIPYEQRRPEGAKRGGRVIVLLSELRTYAPSYFASIREELEVDG